MQRNLGQVLSQLLQSGVSEMPMLLMVYFQTDQFAQIETMARSILDMHVAIRKLSIFSSIEAFFLTCVFHRYSQARFI